MLNYQLLQNLGQQIFQLKISSICNIGDVIELNQKIDDPLTVKVGEYTKIYWYNLVNLSKKLAIQIIEHIERRRDEDDE